MLNSADDLSLIAAPVAPDQPARLAALHADAFAAPWGEAALADLFAQVGVFALAHADGFILCRTVADEAEILTLAVRPDARRCGLGRRLVEAAARITRGSAATRLFLEVAEDNAAARALYTQCGFAGDGRRRGYYARPSGSAVDALLMSLNLA